MRIAHVIPGLDPATGGPPAVLFRMAAAQAALGHDVLVFGKRKPERHQVVVDFYNQVRGIDAVEIVELDEQPSKVADLLSTEMPRALKARAPFDVVHIHAVWEGSLVRVASWCRRSATPYVIRPAGMLDVWSLKRRRLKKRIALTLFHGRMIAGAGAIQALNAHERDTVDLLGYARRIEVIPNGVFLDEIERPVDASAFRDPHPSLGDSPYVLFLSRLHYKKGLDILAEAWTRVSPDFPDHKLVVAGPREDDSIDRLTRRLEQADLAHTLVVPGEVYGDAKTGAFKGARCFVLPSRQEGFSVAITEALALGTPVVVSRDCHFPEVTEVSAGIETSLDPADVAGALARMLSDDDLRRRAGEAGATLVRDRFTWPRIAEQTIRLYQRLSD